FGPDAGQPTSLGSTACDAIEKLGAVQRTVGQSADAMFHQVKRDLSEFVAVTMRGAYNPHAVATYNRAARYPNQLAKEVDTVLKHPVCGSAAALRSLKRWFDQEAQNLMSVGRIAQDVGQATAALAPAAPEALKIAGEAAKLTDLATRTGRQAQSDIE